ncbi:hypothetical protein [Carbonactinospora thermoautotrophica]|uniref:hypothetical protein n=1 Tax=Carbonactinospora thermoautotrophica TaxID=1469144 RepID=UPI00226F8A17|nr:hypothetical protein [Carbonactinospora thermoautotrophica]
MFESLVSRAAALREGAVSYLAADLDPAPKPPPGLEAVAQEWIAYVKWISIIAGILGLMACGIMMMIGRRNRSHLAGEGAAGIPWVLAGLSVVTLAAGIVTSIIS